MGGSLDVLTMDDEFSRWLRWDSHDGGGYAADFWILDDGLGAVIRIGELGFFSGFVGKRGRWILVRFWLCVIRLGVRVVGVRRHMGRRACDLEVWRLPGEKS
jgi:hypothetical protein